MWSEVMDVDAEAAVDRDLDGFDGGGRRRWAREVIGAALRSVARRAGPGGRRGAGRRPSPKGIALVAALGLALVTSGRPAAASITATASASTAELGAGSDTLTSVGSAAAGPIGLVDDAGSAGFGSASGDTLDGIAAFVAHGCAGPNPIKSTGSANGLSRVDVLESFTIVSGTHPVGTFVDVSFQFAAVVAFHPLFNNGDSIGDGLGGYFDLAVGAYSLGQFSGSVSHSGNAIDGVATIIQGAWDGVQVTQVYTTNGYFRVGDTVTVFVNGLAQAGASADWAPMMASVADADIEVSVTWGASVAISGGGGAVELVSQDTGMPAPPLGHGGIDYAEQQLPPVPPTVPSGVPVPALAPFGVAALAGTLLFVGRRATRRCGSDAHAPRRPPFRSRL